MLAKIKEAKIIRETALQNQLPDSDDVEQSLLLLCVYVHCFGHYGILTLVSTGNGCNCSN